MKDKKSFLAVEITVNGDGKATGAKAGKCSRSMAVQRLKFASDPLHVALCWCSIPSSLQLHRSFVSRLAADHDATNSIFIPVWHLGPLAVVIAGKRLAVEQQTLSPAPRNEWTFHLVRVHCHGPPQTAYLGTSVLATPPNPIAGRWPPKPTHR